MIFFFSICPWLNPELTLGLCSNLTLLGFPSMITLYKLATFSLLLSIWFYFALWCILLFIMLLSYWFMVCFLWWNLISSQARIFFFFLIFISTAEDNAWHIVNTKICWLDKWINSSSRQPLPPMFSLFYYSSWYLVQFETQKKRFRNWLFASYILHYSGSYWSAWAELVLRHRHKSQPTVNIQ